MLPDKPGPGSTQRSWARLADCDLRSVARWGLSRRMQRLHECHERGRLRSWQVLAVGRHVAAALNYLAYELVVRESYCDLIERRSALAAPLPERVTVVTLLGFEDQRPLALERRALCEQTFRNRLLTPGIHLRTPGCAKP